MSVFAVVPVKDLRGTKSRLAPILDPCARAGLTIYMMRRVVRCLMEAEVDEVCVVSPDGIVLEEAREIGATPLLQRSRGLNPALEEGRAFAMEQKASSLLVIPADLPLLEEGDVRVFLARARDSSVAIAPDGAGTGTNALLLSPPGALPFLFGTGSFHKHRDAARERRLDIVEVCEIPHLAFDLDTAEDFRVPRLPAGREAVRRGRRPFLSGVEVMPVEEIPEINSGDDLPEILFHAAGDILRPGDILVVTHKVVSKAEGCLVDLASIEPSEFAKDFASRFDKDPRHVEVVLRESRRVVRMDRGVIISETRHGFVCANAGVDASNIPGEDVVCLLPEDPDVSATRIHERLREKISLHIPVIISDSFGRPWRNGITNIAIGVAGMNPLADYRGQADPHGYPLEASVLAVADEVAAASELVMNKTDAVPAAIIRNYPYKRGSGTAKDLVMDPKRDLFR